MEGTTEMFSAPTFQVEGTASTKTEVEVSLIFAGTSGKSVCSQQLELLRGMDRFIVLIVVVFSLLCVHVKTFKNCVPFYTSIMPQ